MSKLCDFCGSADHTAFYCRRKPNKPLQRSAFKPDNRHPLRRVGKQTKLWIDTRKLWIETYGSEGHLCHYCGKLLSDNEFLIDDGQAQKLTLDHLDARTRAPDLRHEFANLTPACGSCNRNKGSLAHDEFVHNCYTPLPPYKPLLPRPTESPAEKS